MFAAPYSPAFAGVPFNAAYGAAATPFAYAGYGAYNAAPFAYGDNFAGLGAWTSAYDTPAFTGYGAWNNWAAPAAAYGGAYGDWGVNTYPAWNTALTAGGYPYAFDGSYNGAWNAATAAGMNGLTTFNDGTLLDISSVANPVNALNGFASPVAPAVPYGNAWAYGRPTAWY